MSVKSLFNREDMHTLHLRMSARSVNGSLDASSVLLHPAVLYRLHCCQLLWWTYMYARTGQRMVAGYN